MPRVYSEANSVDAVAKNLIANYHAHLATARIRFVFVDQGGKKGGREVGGKVKKISGVLEFLLETDFLIEMAEDKWVELNPKQQEAQLDHLLECCVGEEDEETSEMIWSVREPEMQEFASILRRHGAWNQSLHGFVSVAKEIELEAIIEEETGVNVDELLNQSEEN